jgi:hypothetical protein
MKPGDVREVETAGIGVLGNPVVVELGPRARMLRFK